MCSQVFAPGKAKLREALDNGHLPFTHSNRRSWNTYEGLAKECLREICDQYLSDDRED
jgi:hypothetical protein